MPTPGGPVTQYTQEGGVDDLVNGIGDKTLSPLKVFEDLESSVRSYIRSFPAVFSRAQGSRVWDVDGREYIDFIAGAGALNYGHNNPRLKERLVAYIQEDGITHSLDLATSAKAGFLEAFQDVILKPRGMSYKVMFPGPAGTNAVESALKLARKVTGRTTVMAFTNAFHGMTLGSLAATGNRFKRGGAGLPLTNTVIMPYDQYVDGEMDTADYLEQVLDDEGSGIPLPAAIILETVQGEGGVNVARGMWLKKIEKLCRRREIVLIVDDIQVGCGRTGPFFSFEPYGLNPDLVCLSKSLSGYGLPLSVTLIRPEMDIWDPGEHNGTFRGQDLAFLTATEALAYWRTDALTQGTLDNAERVRTVLQDIADAYPSLEATVRGRGLIQGLALGRAGMGAKISQAAFQRGLMAETSGPEGQVLKLLPPLTIDLATLDQGLQILRESVVSVLA